jgi:hypothetical protein
METAMAREMKMRTKMKMKMTKSMLPPVKLQGLRNEA